MTGREIECGVLSAEDGRGPEASVCAEIGYGATTTSTTSRRSTSTTSPSSTCRPTCRPTISDRVRSAACAAFDAVGCEDYARVDFFVTDDGRVVLNEINTIPGFTHISLFPRMWQASGVEYPDLVARLVRTALRKRSGPPLSLALGVHGAWCISRGRAQPPAPRRRGR